MSPTVQNDDGLPVQVVGAPIGRNVSAMAPNRADFLSAGGLPHILAVFDRFSREQELPFRGNYLRRDRRRRADCFISNARRTANETTMTMPSAIQSFLYDIYDSSE